MAVYYTNDAAFDLPDLPLIDRTVTTLDAVTPDGRAHTVCVNRAPLPAGKDLAALVADSLAQASRRLPAHKVLFQRDASVASCPAVEIAAAWRGQLGMVYTRQAHLVAGGLWLVLSGNAPLDDRAACDACLDHAFATFRLRD